MLLVVRRRYFLSAQQSISSSIRQFRIKRPGGRVDFQTNLNNDPVISAASHDLLAQCRWFMYKSSPSGRPSMFSQYNAGLTRPFSPSIFPIYYNCCVYVCVRPLHDLSGTCVFCFRNHPSFLLLYVKKK